MKPHAINLAKGPKLAEDLVQSLLLLADTLEMREVDFGFNRHGAFESIIQV